RLKPDTTFAYDAGMSRIDRRDFLKAAPIAAGALAASRSLAHAAASSAAPADRVRIASNPYTPVADYPIKPVRYDAVTLTDTFWKPRVALNAAVTIPLEVEKLSERPRGLDGNVLEAALLSLKTHPDPRLQAIVDARVREIAETPAT